MSIDNDAIFSATGANAVTDLPETTDELQYPVGEVRWFKDSTHNDPNLPPDGTEVRASELNAISGNLREVVNHAVDDLGAPITRQNSNMTMLTDAVTAIAADQVLQNISEGPGVSISPTGEIGLTLGTGGLADTNIVDRRGSRVMLHDGTSLQQTSPFDLVNSIYTAGANTTLQRNDMTGTVAINADLSGAVPISRTITTSGIASGGGDLSSNISISVPASSVAEIDAGISNSSAVTPALLAYRVGPLASSIGGKVDRAGDTMTGPLTVPDLRIGAMMFSNDLDTGITRPAADQIGFSAGGVLAARMRDSGIQLVDGNSTIPALGFISEPGLGIYRSANNTLGIGANLTSLMTFSPALVQTDILFRSNNAVHLADGTAALPALAFTNDPNTGFYSAGADQIGFSTGGAQRFLLGSSGATLATDLMVSRAQAGGSVVSETINSSTANNSSARVRWSTGVGNAVVSATLTNGSGVPYFLIGSGSGVSGITHDFASHAWRSLTGTSWMSLNSNGDLVLSRQNDGAAVIGQIINTSTANSSSAMLRLTTGLANSQVHLALSNSTGTPHLIFNSGTAVPGFYRDFETHVWRSRGGTERMRLENTGLTLAGPITLPGAPSSDLHAATKKYVDDLVTGGVTPASSIAFSPAGNISSTNMQSAIEELDSEKAPLTGTGTSGTWPIGVTGNAATATTLATARTIAGVSFNGSANIAIPFGNLTSKPTTLAGYGITDAVPIISGSGAIGTSSPNKSSVARTLTLNDATAANFVAYELTTADVIRGRILGSSTGMWVESITPVPLYLRYNQSERVTIGASTVDFAVPPAFASAPTAGSHLANKTYVDSVAGGGGGPLVGTPLNEQAFAASGTWTKPAVNGSWAFIEIWGAGQGGGRDNPGNNRLGGEGGQYVSFWCPFVAMPSSISAVVGAGGTGQNFNQQGSAGNPGGDSIFFGVTAAGGFIRHDGGSNYLKNQSNVPQLVMFAVDCTPRGAANDSALGVNVGARTRGAGGAIYEMGSSVIKDSGMIAYNNASSYQGPVNTVYSGGSGGTYNSGNAHIPHSTSTYGGSGGAAGATNGVAGSNGAQPGGGGGAGANANGGTGGAGYIRVRVY